MKRNFLFLAGILLVTPGILAQPVVIAPDRESGVYHVGDTVHWTIEWKGTNLPAARYTFKSGGLSNVGSGQLQFTNNLAHVDSRLEEPNTMLLEVAWQPENNFNRAWGGAVAAPEKIKPAAPAPADFDAFWQERLKEV